MAYVDPLLLLVLDARLLEVLDRLNAELEDDDD